MSYRTAHEAVAAARGAASWYSCLDCGNTARHWAFRYDSSSELRSPEGSPYSLDVMDYDPMCVGCHRRRDLAEDERVAQAAYAEGVRLGRQHSQRLASDPEFASRRSSESSKIMYQINTDPKHAEVMTAAREKAKKSSAEAAARTGQRKFRCLDCDLVAPPGPLGTHRRYSGHAGSEEVF